VGFEGQSIVRGLAADRRRRQRTTLAPIHDLDYRAWMAQEASREERWRALLDGDDPRLSKPRPLFKHIPSPPRCKLCCAPFGRPGSLILGPMGYRAWSKNPTLCDACVRSLGNKGLGGAEIELSFLFADVRGSTTIAEQVGPSAFTTLLNRFYDAVSRAVIDNDGLVDKFVGDEVVAFFVPAFSPAYAAAAVAAARESLDVTGHGDPAGPWIPVGIGVHTGVAFVGSVGSEGGGVADFTALGDPVNVTARLASEAGPGEILITESTVVASGLSTVALERRELNLRGRQERIVVFVDRVGSSLSGPTR